MNRVWGQVIGTAILSLVFSATAMAKPALNSMCYKEDKANASIQGSDAENMYQIASVSKIVTSFWAIDKLGPDYRFITTLYITPLNNGLVDLHISGGWDPYFGREMMHFLVSELNRNGVRQVRDLSFDENFSMFWNIREKPTLSFSPSPQNIEIMLRQKLRLNKKEYQHTLITAARVGVDMEPNPSLTFKQVSFVPSTQFQRTDDTHAMILKSAPLYRYLKEMNRNSNNNVADHLFNFLGGVDKFKDFMDQRLKMNINEIRFVNGSGDRIFVGDGRDKQKVYNEASCDALINVIVALREDLRKTSKYDLQDIMAVSGLDQKTTLGSRYDGAATSGAIVAKTGTVDPAVTLAGMISTSQGDVYFGILYKTKGPADWSKARNAIRSQVTDLMDKYGGKDLITNYASENFLPFDGQSSLLADSIPAPSTQLHLN